MPKDKTPYKRSAGLYIDRAGRTAIVVPLHQNGPGGFLLEDDSPQVIRPPDNPASLGQAVWQALKASKVLAPTNQRTRKLTDWPAFKVSGSDSVRCFEQDFIHLRISGANEANIIYEIEGSPVNGAELRVSASSNPDPEALGHRCLAVWKACRDRRV